MNGNEPGLTPEGAEQGGGSSIDYAGLLDQAQQAPAPDAAPSGKIDYVKAAPEQPAPATKIDYVRHTPKSDTPKAGVSLARPAAEAPQAPIKRGVSLARRAVAEATPAEAAARPLSVREQREADFEAEMAALRLQIDKENREDAELATQAAARSEAQPPPPAAPERAAERLAPAEIARLARGTVQVNTILWLTPDQQSAFRAASEAAGRPLVLGASAGWQEFGDQAPSQLGRTTFANIPELSTDRTKSYEGIILEPRPDDTVRVIYKYGNNTSEQFGVNERGYNYPDSTGRPGNELSVAFELPAAAARALEAAASEDPQYVRDAVEAVVLDLGLPKDAWEKGHRPVKPSYVEPPAGYHISIHELPAKA